MKGNIVYVYAILDEKRNISYIGKSSSPKARLYAHAAILKQESLSIKILDFFYDTENYWIKKAVEEGNTLYNKQVDPIEESWEIGDIITVDKRVDKKVLDSSSGITYKSRFHCHRELGISYHIVKEILDNPSYNNKTKYRLQYVD